MGETMTVALIDPIKAMLVKIWGYVPSILGAILILVIGSFIAKLIETVVARVLKMVKLDMASEKAGIEKILAQGDVKMTLSEIIAAIIYWCAILIVIATALSALNLNVAAELITRLAEYVPSILAAVFIIVLGSFLANFVGTVVRTSASNAGVGTAKLLGKIAQVILMVFAVIVAIEQLKIATALIILSANIVLMAIGLGLAIAFGLGCKDIAGKFVQDAINSLKK
ncbi:MAG: hypothetical protein KBB52_04355 [Candidatus Omnitrophica bacterium]|nr:hypothetical protein [Candidatus Omnitrophota bacterium]